MRYLHYTGLAPNAHTLIYDARDAGPGYGGTPLRINPGDKIPIEAFANAEWSGDVAARHVEMGLAIMIEEKETTDATSDDSGSGLGEDGDRDGGSGE